MMILLKHITKKRMSHWLILFFVLLCNDSYSQFNLVPNPSFEYYNVCPKVGIKASPLPWYTPTNGSPGFVDTCSTDPLAGVPYNGSGYQMAKTGGGYIGLYFLNGINNNKRNYIQVKLLDSLSLGYCYYVEFFINCGNTSKYATNNLGLLITNNPIYVDTFHHPYGVLPANPQILNYGNPIIKDTQNWIKVSSLYIAQGGEKYITLGNFKYDNQTNYLQIQALGLNGAGYLIDDVSVIPLDSMPLKADAGKDTSIANVGDSVFIGSLTNGLTGVKWYNSSGALIDTGRPGFYVKPTASTFYIIEQMVCGYYSRDTVNVNVGTVPLKFISYSVSIPLLGGVRGGSIENIWQTANEINVSHFNIQRSTNGKDFTTIGKVSANNKSYNEYSFIDDSPLSTVDSKQLTLYYRIESVDKDGKVNYSPTRTLNFKPQTLNGICVYPNPAKDNLTIQCKGAKELFIIDYLGKEVYSKKIINNQESIINVQRFPKGIYAVKAIMANGEIKTEKIIIQ
jgi:hypothetical protein